MSSLAITPHIVHDLPQSRALVFLSLPCRSTRIFPPSKLPYGHSLFALELDPLLHLMSPPQLLLMPPPLLLLMPPPLLLLMPPPLLLLMSPPLLRPLLHLASSSQSS
ncbi:hypothetical protein WMY93_020382 [Mugilogobius chulae]|uniref:Uncharacterized protein n=1 Tax=Mugilogobius chulae TaxID=88201 RepID=A0AAW0NMS3_9GOBI